MQVSANKVVSFHFKLSEADGELLESSYGSEPTLYLHGHSNLLSGLEAALESKTIGDKVSVTLAPADAYGERREGAVQRVPMKHLHNHQSLKNKLKPGMKVQINTAHGLWDAVVLKVGKFNVDIDSNHPLAGKTLTFDLEIVEIRDASDEEIAHGHAHGVGGHHHD